MLHCTESHRIAAYPVEKGRSRCSFILSACYYRADSPCCTAHRDRRSWKRRKSSTLDGHWKCSRQSQSGRPLCVYFGQFNAISLTIDRPVAPVRCGGRLAKECRPVREKLYANERGATHRFPSTAILSDGYVCGLEIRGTLIDGIAREGNPSYWQVNGGLWGVRCECNLIFNFKDIGIR